jgi:hypothetical protein
MSHNTWIGTVLRFARNRACHMLQTQPQGATQPDYDIPAFIRRGIRIPALEQFRGSGSAARATTVPAASSNRLRHRPPMGDERDT